MTERPNSEAGTGVWLLVTTDLVTGKRRSPKRLGKSASVVAFNEALDKGEKPVMWEQKK